MKQQKYMMMSLLVLFLMQACDGQSKFSSVNPSINTNNVNTDSSIIGAIQKGPFVVGSSIVIQELDNNLAPNGTTFEIQTIDDFGNFALDSTVNSEYVEVIADGFYLNEVTGQLSDANLTLRAIAEVNQGAILNVNILTTLAAPRLRYLVASGVEYTNAKSQTEIEVLNIFGITGNSLAFEQMDISQAGNSHAILLAVSAISQGDLSVALMSEFITKLGLDIRTDGVLNDAGLVAQIATQAAALNLTAIRNHIVSHYALRGQSVTPGSFENYIDSQSVGQLNGQIPTFIQINIDNNTVSENNGPNPGYLAIPVDIVLAGLRPTQNITVDLSGPELNVIPAQLIFTPDNYTAPQTVQIEGVSEFGMSRNGITIPFVASSSQLASNAQIDLIFSEMGETITLQNWDHLGDAGATTVIGYVDRPATTTWTWGENYPNEYKIKLNEWNLDPTATVEITVTSDRPDLVTIPNNVLSFNATNYSDLQTLVVEGIFQFEDSRNGQEVTFTISSNQAGFVPVQKTMTFFDENEPEIVTTFHKEYTVAEVTAATSGPLVTLDGIVFQDTLTDAANNSYTFTGVEPGQMFLNYFGTVSNFVEVFNPAGVRTIRYFPYTQNGFAPTGGATWSYPYGTVVGARWGRYGYGPLPAYYNIGSIEMYKIGWRGNDLCFLTEVNPQPVADTSDISYYVFCKEQIGTY